MEKVNKQKREQLNKKNKQLIYTSAVVIVLTALLITFSVLYFMQLNTNKNLQMQIENIYQKNFYELVDNVNNSEVKLSKVLASDYKSYARKMLEEISLNTSEASKNLASLPISLGGIDETIQFVNQVSGYTETLSKNLDNGKSLSVADIGTLKNLHSSFVNLKDNLNKISQSMLDGGIFDLSNNLSGDYNAFTVSLSDIKSNDVEYPTMIYDGPFSDSETTRQIKNISKTKVDEKVAKDKVCKVFKDKCKDVNYVGDTNGKFTTYDYKITLSNGDEVFVQMTKQGANFITMVGNNNSDAKNISLDKAIENAKLFAKDAGIDNLLCVWSDISSNDAYINLAPVVDNIIYYPDLVKVKVDLATGNVIGYEANSYYTNHTKRTLEKVLLTDEQAKLLVPKDFTIISCKNALAPLEYNKEVLCKELKCSHNGSIYYLYYNASNGVLENILRVVSTDEGSLLL